MAIELRPETQLLVEEEIRSGYVSSVDELIHFAVKALREQRVSASGMEKTRSLPQPGRKSLVEVFAPVRGFDLDFTRNPSSGRPVDL